MAIANSGNKDDVNGELGNASDFKKGRKYIYIGSIFTIIAIMMAAYLAMVLFSESFFPFVGLDGIIDHFPFYDNPQNKAEFEGYSGSEVILLCCSWGEELADGELTYFIGSYTIDEDSNDVRHEVDKSSIEAVTKAFEDWDSKIEGLKFSESPTRRDADIEIYFRQGQNEKAGITHHYYDFYGFITKSYVLISKGAFGFAFSRDQIEQIVKHEIGHTLGLGHANFDGNLMAAQVNRGSTSVSACEVEAIYTANEWWFEKTSGSQALFIRQPTTDHIECR